MLFWDWGSLVVWLGSSGIRRLARTLCADDDLGGLLPGVQMFVRAHCVKIKVNPNIFSRAFESQIILVTYASENILAWL